MIVFVVIAIAGSFFAVGSLKARRQQSDKSVEVNDVVNKYIQEAHGQNAINQRKIDIALAEARRKIIADRDAFQAKQAKEIQEIPIDKQVWKESDVQSKADLYTAPVETSKLSEDDEGRLDVSKLSPEEKREYARQYIENAKKGGYQIELSDDLEVIRAVPIRKPSQSDSYEANPSD